MGVVERSRSFWNVRAVAAAAWWSLAAVGRFRPCPKQIASPIQMHLRCRGSLLVCDACQESPLRDERHAATRLAWLRLGLARLVMNSYHVAGQSIIARERLFLDAQCTANLLLAYIVNRILVSGKIIRTREDRVARLARCRVDSLALVRPRLRVAL